MPQIEILLAEDNQDHADLLVESLESCDASNQIQHVTDGRLALEFLRKEGQFSQSDHAVPDLILLDIKMPRLNGIETLEAIKSDDRLRRVPVIMMTTSCSRDEVNRCYDLGANSYITKPLQFDELTQKIKRFYAFWAMTSERPDRVGV